MHRSILNIPKKCVRIDHSGQRNYLRGCVRRSFYNFRLLEYVGRQVFKNVVNNMSYDYIFRYLYLCYTLPKPILSNYLYPSLKHINV